MAKNIELYNKTVDILFQSYFNDTLRHSNCYACACGNIVAANMGYEFVPNKDKDDEYPAGNIMNYRQEIVWHTTGGKYSSGPDTWYDELSSDEYYENGRREIECTGYSVKEFYSIERAFEGAARGNSEEDYMFNGLVAVLEVLKQIHEIDDNTDQMERFTAHHKVRVSA